MRLSDYQIWFLTGSQHLYGAEAIAQVGEHSREIVAFLNTVEALPLEIVYQPVLTTADEIHAFASPPTTMPSASASSPGCILSRRPRTGSPA